MSSRIGGSPRALATLVLWMSGCAVTVASTQGSPADGGADAGPPPIVELAAAGPNTCALRSDGRVRCWGRYGVTSDPMAPPAGTIAEVAGLSDARRIAVQSDGPARGCAVREGGEVVCWITNGMGAVGRPTAVVQPLPARARDVAMGGAHVCALTVAGGVLCWGDNSAGQLGAGDVVAHEGAVPVTGLPVVEELSASESNTCARSADGAVFCWGRNFQGALGDGVARHDCPGRDASEDCSPVPVRVVGLGAASRISAGLNSGCAIVQGVPYCWGWSTALGTADGGLGEATRPTRMGDLTEVTEVFAGYVTGAAIRRGEVFSWGVQFSSDRDAGDVTNARPQLVAGIRGARQVTGGWYHQCALLESGEVDCWGDGGFGQLARPGASRSGPVRIEGIAPAMP